MAAADPSSSEILIHETAEKYRNWGKWGENDQLGTLNYITGEKVVEAASLVKRGHIVSLALPFDARGPQRGGNRINPVHTMLMTGADIAAGGQSFLPHGFGVADDMVTMPLQCGTQWDGLSHIFDRGKMWNGYSADEVTSLGAKRNGIEQAGNRVVTRGVLLDMARYKGTDALEPGYAITEGDLMGCIEAQGETSDVRRGDAVIVRTGQLGHARANRWGKYAGGDAPGLSFWTADWLYRSEIAAAATDTWGFEVRPNELEGSFQPLHQVIVPNVGLLVGEIFDLEELGAYCAEIQTYEFLFAASPLPFTGAVGSPVNPQAVF